MNESNLSAEFTDIQGDSQYAACRRFWNAILLAQLEDMISTPDKRRSSLKYHSARSWFGEFPKADFREVCENAGHDPDAVWVGAMKINDSSEADRMAAVKRMVVKRREEE